MSSGSHKMTMFERTVEQSFSNQACRMRHVAHDKGARTVRNGPDPGIIPVPAIGAGAADDELWLFFFSHRLHHIVVDPAIFFSYSIEDRAVELTGEIDGGAMCQVPAHAQVQPKN